MAFIDTVKQWFKTGDYPTQNQFYQTFENLRWKDEMLEITDVNNLQAQLNSLGNQPELKDADGDDIAYTVPDGYLLTLIVWICSTPATPTCQYAAGSPGDIVPASDTAKLKDVWNVGLLAVGADENIIVKNVPAGGKVFFIRRKLL